VITSPIDGVVVSRGVDVGQTVAASLSAPTLFTLAGDLRRMQVVASIDEADIGKVSNQAEVSFTVDAHPTDRFRGRVLEVRLSPQTAQNVVTYSVIIDVDNSGLKLKPGMTANLTLTVAEADGTLRVPNSALRFRPQDESQVEAAAEGGQGGRAGQRAASEAGQAGAEQRERGRSAERGNRPGQSVSERPTQAGTVWVLTQSKKLARRRVVTGITDGQFTEVISGDLREGEVVVLGQTVQKEQTGATRQTSPFGMPGTSGGAGRGGRR
jgi:HlyD family secretion protein